MPKEKSASPVKPLGFDTTRWLHSLVALVLTAGACSVVWELAALHAHRPFLATPVELYPDVFTLQTPPFVVNTTEWMAIDGDVDTDVNSDDMLHLGYLQIACEEEKDAVVPWRFAANSNPADRPEPDPQHSTSLYQRNDPRLLDELRRCPDVDIYMPSTARDIGGCTAVAGPLKFLQARLLPQWAFDTKVYDIVTRQKTSYFEICPNTPVLFMAPEHVLAVTKSSSWPTTKPVYLMAPGVNLKTTSTPVNFTQSVLELTDVVLCRTMRCDQDIKQFLVQQHAEKINSDSNTDTDAESNSKQTRVLYTSQATVDPNNFAQRILGGDVVPRSKADFAYSRFAHTTWNISSKATQDVLNCWSTHKKELPPLDVYLLKGKYGENQNVGYRLYKPFPGDQNTKKHLWDVVKFSKEFGQASFFICPTAEDDCLDLARASGGVVVTADAYPMNELISAPSEGVLFPTQESVQLLQSNDTSYHSLVPDDALLLPPPVPTFNGADLCAAILRTRTSTSMNDRLAIVHSLHTIIYSASTKRHARRDPGHVTQDTITYRSQFDISAKLTAITPYPSYDTQGG
ncbi:hypothetical protein JM18_007516 [Phytophthora kernoviae]|uniref:Uncharacterized protein n=2 Tax=Phytophthora kernoviae TaxID=325452 RepID=A0A921SC38_9STRA|nr:hypothetical protein G195_008853 [Phytophthora kernoviae 00238/432]KAG2518612.1 hypothetical protein JM18_007516 [Phytophthora kernoviae]